MSDVNNECNHDCSTCSSDCKPAKKESNTGSKIGKVIGVISGKGGVGKSLVTSMLAVTAQRRDYKTAILDADITGPSIPKIFKLEDKIKADENGKMLPCQTTTGIKVVSVNLLLQEESMPVIWRGPVISGTVNQFWQDTVWGDVDYMFIDMPPGTGDVPLTVFQSIPLSGIIIVTSPQELVSMIVAKAVNMARMMNIPILGMIENYSYALCPDCGKKIELFGKSHIDEAAIEHNIDILAKLPLDPKLAALCDKGMLELMDNNLLDNAFDKIEA
ncbi:MAG: Mrp/NBP35 family ATP-binding protein [Clostridiales bacterium]|nr:Mrp/NBP35 family ATP-binding protein [Clostridiales bacterium]